MNRTMGILCAATLLAASSAWAQKNDPNPGPSLLGLPCAQGQTRLCIPLDQTFTVVRMDASTGGNGQADPLDPCQRNDDDSSLAIPLQFNFDFYGSTFTDVFVNNNGNVSFGTPFPTFTATGFPVADFPMIAPFWADVDSRDGGSGSVYFKSEAHRFTVIWDHVGYFNVHSDKLSTFEVILSDGTDPVVGIGSNVCFCYDDMQWTTGDASGGSGGFGGVPATVGANRGDGTDFFQIGLFDHAGSDYDGPGGNNDGVDFLDNQRTCFNTGSATNIPPSFVNLPDGCLQAFVGTPLVFTVRAISPELGQTTTLTENDGGLANFSCVNTPGNPASSVCTFTPDASQVGTHVVVYTATDDFQPPASTVATICIEVSECPTMIGFDFSDGDEIPRGTEITNQFAFQGVRVSGVSFDTGHPGVFTNRNGGPGSDTDDLNAASAPNFITTMPRDPFDPRESDFGMIRFDFVDPQTGSPLAVDFVSLKFLDVEDSGVPGRGTSMLRAIRANGTHVDVNVPAGPNGSIQTVHVGTIGNEDSFVAAEAFVGDVNDSAAVDDLCYHQVETAIQLACTATPNPVPRGGTISLRLGIKNTTNSQMPVQVSIEAGSALVTTTPLSHVILSRQLVLPRHFDDTSMADRELVEIQVPANVRLRLIGRPLQILTRATNPTEGWDYARDRFVFVIQ